MCESSVGKLRFLVVLPALNSVGGIQRFNRNFIRALIDNDVMVDLVILNDEICVDASNIDCGINAIFACNGNKIKFASTIFRLLATVDYDGVVVGHINFAFLAQALKALTFSFRSPFYLILHGVETWNRVKGVRCIGSMRFDAAVAVSSYTLESFINQSNGKFKGRTAILPNTLNSEIYEYNKLPVNKNIVVGKLMLLAVSRLSSSEREKGIIHIFEAMKLLQTEVDLSLVLIGDGDDLPYLRDYARRCGVEERVEFAGRLSDQDMWEKYLTADVFVLPSSKEGFGIVFLEAGYFGLPVIGASEKGILDVIRHGDNGFLVPYGAPNQLAEALRSLAQDVRLREYMGSRGHNLVVGEGEFSFTSFVRKQRRIFLEQH